MLGSTQYLYAGWFGFFVEKSPLIFPKQSYPLILFQKVSPKLFQKEFTPNFFPKKVPLKFPKKSPLIFSQRSFPLNFDPKHAFNSPQKPPSIFWKPPPKFYKKSPPPYIVYPSFFPENPPTCLYIFTRSTRLKKAFTNNCWGKISGVCTKF